MVLCKGEQSKVLNADRSTGSLNVLQLREYDLLHRFQVQAGHHIVEMDGVQRDSWPPFPTALL